MVSIPYTTQNVSLFTEPLAVALATTTSGAEIRYTLDGSEPTETSALYAAPVPVDRSLTLKAKGFKPGAAPSRTLTLEAEKQQIRIEFIFQSGILIPELLYRVVPAGNSLV